MTTDSPTPGSPAELDALFALALREHQAGRLAEAAAAYQRILALRPGAAEAHHNLANVLRDQGQFDQAVARYQQALAVRPDLVDALNNLGIIFAKHGQFDQAVAWLEQAIARKPDHAEAHNNLGNVLLGQRKLDQAAACYQQAILLRPDYATAHSNLGNILWQQGKLDQAVARFEQAIALRPNYAEALNNLGNVLWRQEKFDQAVTRIKQALALRPDYAEAHNNLGNVLLKQDKLAEATAYYVQALAFRPDFAEAYNNLAGALKRQGKLDEAVAHYEQALALRPDYAEAHYNLGNALAEQVKFDQAVARFEQALALKPDYADAHNNLANVLLSQGKIDAATAHYEQALALRPDYAEAQLGLAACFLVNADYERGWLAYEGRLRAPGGAPQLNLSRWTGQPLAGRRLLLFGEQGSGDTIQFVRYARLLKERGARVVLACQPALGRLLASHPDVDELFILGSGEQLPRSDYYLPLMSAPSEFHTDGATIPCEVPYLWADPALTDEWRRELAAIEGFKIGIVWQGSRGYPWDRQRSISLAQFAPLARLPGVRLISLQKGFGSEQVSAVNFPVLDLSGRLDEAAGPFMDTAAVIRNLDLVVAPDTAIAHLAGALGSPVWLPLQFSPNWRWLREREDSPWYPTARLFRQTAFGEWSDVFERIANAVQARRAETE